MSAPLPSPTSTVPAACASCEEALVGKFCHHCGEKLLDRHDYALGHWLEHTVDAFTHFDFKVGRSIWSLLRHPGQMTAEVLAGRRVVWAKPVQVFIIVNLLYYVLATVLHLSTFQTPLMYHFHSPYGGIAEAWSKASAAQLHLTLPEYAARFDALAHTLAKSLVIFFVPVFALLFGLLERRARRYALEHVTAALHFTSLLLLLLPLPYPVVFGLFALKVFARTSGDSVWTLTVGLLIGYYATRFLPRVYGIGRWTAIGHATILVVTFYAALIFLYRPLLFLIVRALL